MSDFRDKEGYKPNVKLDYIDDNGRILNAKEAFRYLSHKFHGKGPGKNKIEKRLKKVEQEGVSQVVVRLWRLGNNKLVFLSADDANELDRHATRHVEHAAGEAEGDTQSVCNSQRWQAVDEQWKHRKVKVEWIRFERGK